MGVDPPAQAIPELAILSNAAALHSLKRPQLVALCKQHGLKGSGKNVELIARLEERGRFLATIADDEDSLAVGDESTASWSVVPAGSASNAPLEADFGPADINKSDSTSSISSVTSTLRSAGTAFLRTIVSSTSTSKTPAPATEPEPVALTTTTNIYPSLSAFQTEDLSTASPPSALSDIADLRPVSRPSLPSEVADAASTTEPFVFGSPVKGAACTTGSKAFTFTMPGTLTASTGSTNMEEVEDPPKSTAIDSVMEEMTRRAAEARALAETSGIKRSSSILLGPFVTSSTQPSTQGKRAVFEASHKRTFDRMDSITTHWAAKRSIHSSSDLAGMTRSDSRSKISDEGSEPQAKRLKPAVTTQSARGSDRDNKVVARLRESGWSSSADQRAGPSVADSLSSGVASLGRSRKDGKAGEQSASLSEQARRKRQLELAKKRRKSGAVNGAGLSKRRPSLGVGPKSSLYRATVKKVEAAPPVPPLPKTLAAPLGTRLGTIRPEADSTIGARSTPRFAAPTASTSSRAAATAAASPIIRRSMPSPEKPASRKKFDLQESLKRPITWRSHLRSPAVATASTSFSPVGRTGGPDGKEEPHASGPASFGKLLALPPAPTSPFSFSAPAQEDPVAEGTASRSLAPSTSSWQPPAITKRPLQPMTPQPPLKAPGLKPTTAKKTVSASSRSVRGSEKETSRRRLECLESHARRVRAKAAAAKARAAPT
ncbi:hypothetical protein JCM8115_005931 [Rhodotorula mucilaginosa]|uniref:SAP domain-containing protein n=1 Tax=Rhodotorula mucilaginosa TaxID=5537 RepID=A0A9P7B5M0_RHOMI|nr:hypothetical protein C6P46_004813 [Rhodotorula mucilaginosa]